uniref:Uncharacterized protein n=1 Tax=Cajanus cajan TaxID=3821 RepID=A0A151S098_CAJCA|nr:hypothetical protein KK1_030106 [Cajanus cajan]
MPVDNVNSNPTSGIILSTIKSSFSSPTCWLLDSGATNHICFSKQSFHDLTTIKNSFVTLPNGSRIPIEGIGSVYLFPKLILTNVFYIPTFTFSLISLSELLYAHSLRIIFFDNSFIIQDKLFSLIIGKGESHNGLYILHTDSMQFNTVSFKFHCNSVSLDIWHHRLGHLSHDSFVTLNNKYNLISSRVPHFPCRVCPLEK